VERGPGEELTLGTGYVMAVSGFQKLY
jgi:hypothetical protein